jgi:signal transduction histidine kinase
VASFRRGSNIARLAAFVPRGAALPERAWLARHRGIVVLLWFHVVALVVIGAMRHEPVAFYVLAPALVAAFTAAAMWERLSRNVRASMTTLGLLSSSAILIAYYDGLIEAHFHFFVTVAIVSLYQSWPPYFLAVGFVLTHHLAFGTLLPLHVYNHQMALDSPWLFAVVHGAAVLAESVACLVFWRVSEEALDAERANKRALEHTNAELTRANVAVSDLVAMLSHDLRTPLTVLLGFSDLAKEAWPEMSEAERMEFVHTVSRAGHSLQSLLEDTLTVSALEGAGLQPRPVPVRIDKAVREALDTLPGPLPDIALDELEAVTAVVDRGHLGQVLTNLLTNAIKYGGGRLAVRTDAGDEEVIVRVADSGQGVPAAFVPQLFERYSRSDQARQGAQRGTGLGLYITRSLLLANGGDITYEPTPGGGATFRLQLPRAARTADLVAL